MPLKTHDEETQILKIPGFNMMDHTRLIKYGKRIGMTKREAAAKILKEFLRKHVKLEIEV
jgi:hypothetical protein